jgi:hypothetical protein
VDAGHPEFRDESILQGAVRCGLWLAGCPRGSSGCPVLAGRVRPE